LDDAAAPACGLCWRYAAAETSADSPGIHSCLNPPIIFQTAWMTQLRLLVDDMLPLGPKLGPPGAHSCLNPSNNISDSLDDAAAPACGCCGRHAAAGTAAGPPGGHPSRRPQGMLSPFAGTVMFLRKLRETFPVNFRTVYHANSLSNVQFCKG
jgi:hypothetical protein